MAWGSTQMKSSVSAASSAHPLRIQNPALLRLAARKGSSRQDHEEDDEDDLEDLEAAAAAAAKHDTKNNGGATVMYDNGQENTDANGAEARTTLPEDSQQPLHNENQSPTPLDSSTPVSTEPNIVVAATGEVGGTTTASPTLLTDEQRRRLLKRKKRKKRQREQLQQAAALAAAAAADAAPEQEPPPSLDIIPAGLEPTPKRKKTTLKVSKKRGPRTVEYMCALCNEVYSSTCDYNPWWALQQHECPKCHKTQIPRVDISAPANAIEYHPALLAHADENAGGGSAGGAGQACVVSSMHMPPSHLKASTTFPATTVNTSDSDSLGSDLSDEDWEGLLSDDDDDDDDESGSPEPYDPETFATLSPADQAENETFGAEYTGPTLSDRESSRLLILMGHASTCPCLHKSSEHRDICRSTKWMMLHIRDCPGTTSTFDVCPFPWCRKVKHLLYHLVSCVEPETCRICSPKDLNKNMLRLCGLNEYRLRKFRQLLIARVKAASQAITSPSEPTVGQASPKGNKSKAAGDAAASKAASPRSATAKPPSPRSLAAKPPSPRTVAAAKPPCPCPSPVRSQSPAITQPCATSSPRNHSVSAANTVSSPANKGASPAMSAQGEFHTETSADRPESGKVKTVAPDIISSFETKNRDAADTITPDAEEEKKAELDDEEHATECGKNGPLVMELEGNSASKVGAPVACSPTNATAIKLENGVGLKVEDGVQVKMEDDDVRCGGDDSKHHEMIIKQEETEEPRQESEEGEGIEENDAEECAKVNGIKRRRLNDETGDDSTWASKAEETKPTAVRDLVNGINKSAAEKATQKPLSVQ